MTVGTDSAVHVFDEIYWTCMCLLVVCYVFRCVMLSKDVQYNPILFALNLARFIFLVSLLFSSLISCERESEILDVGKIYIIVEVTDNMYQKINNFREEFSHA